MRVCEQVSARRTKKKPISYLEWAVIASIHVFGVVLLFAGTAANISAILTAIEAASGGPFSCQCKGMWNSVAACCAKNGAQNVTSCCLRDAGNPSVCNSAYVYASASL